MLRILFSPSSAHAGPAAIAVGLGMLILAMWWPAAPMVTAIGVLALGSTLATLMRWAHSPSLRPILVTHLVVYANVYALAVGATLHAATPGGITVATAVDLLASVVPIWFAGRLSIDAILHGSPSR